MLTKVALSYFAIPIFWNSLMYLKFLLPTAASQAVDAIVS